MIDLKKAQQVFNHYVHKYNISDDKVALKISHTYRVMQRCQEIAESLKLEQEDIELAGLIGLLHDIGRFEQLRRYDSFIDNKTVDHAALGIEILFNDGLIELFEIDKQYYSLIKTAIFNHNKYEIEPDLDNHTYLHCQIIRDGDKIDIFNTGLLESFEAFLDVSQNVLENDMISDDIFETFMQQQTILSINRKTDLDRWVSFLALVFGLNFTYSFEYVSKHSFIEKLIRRLDYKNPDSKIKMGQIENCCKSFLKDKVDSI